MIKNWLRMSPMYFVYVKKWFCWRSWEPPTKWQFLWREDNILTPQLPPPPPPPPQTTTPAPQHPPHPHPPPHQIFSHIYLQMSLPIKHYLPHLKTAWPTQNWRVRSREYFLYFSFTHVKGTMRMGFYYKTSRRKYNGQNLEIRIEVVTVSLPFISM